MTLFAQELVARRPHPCLAEADGGASGGNAAINASVDEEAARLFYLGRMVSAVAHELNNRLTSVLGFAELLELKPDGVDGRRLMGKLRENTESCRSLTEGICGFSARQRPAPRTADALAVVRQAMDLASCSAKLEGVRMLLDAETDLPAVGIAPVELRLCVFICLDEWVRRLASTGHSGLMITRLRRATNGYAVRVTLEAEGLPDGAQEASGHALEFAAHALQAQGASFECTASAAGTWRCLIGLPEARRSVRTGGEEAT